MARPATVVALPSLPALAAAAALLVLPALPAAAAFDPDCGSDSYTGFALAAGTGCARYVHCSSGIAAPTPLACPAGTLYDGGVGRGGICTWASSVDESKCDEGGGGAPAPAPVPAEATVPVPVPVPAEATVAAASAGRGEPATMEDEMLHFLADHDYGSTSNANGFGSDSDSNSDSNSNGGGGGEDHFYCGTSEDDAFARGCIPCPSGRMDQCGTSFKMGCFRGVAQCAGSGGGNDGGGNGGGIPGALEDNVNDIVEQFLQSNQVARPAPPPAPVPAPRTPPPARTPRTPPPTRTRPAPAVVPAPAPGRPWTMPPWTNAPFRPSPTSAKKTVIGYYASWQWYDRDKFADPVKVDFSKYDRINYAFFQPDRDGNLYGTDEWADPQLLWGPYTWNAAAGDRHCSWDLPGAQGRKCAYHKTEDGIVARAHAVNVEVMPSIGGWTLSGNFPGIAADPNKRANFARQCVELIEAYGFDGIDLDWEYPGYEDHNGTPADTVNFTLLLQVMRYELDRLGANPRSGRPYGLTAALPCGPDKIAKIQVDKIKNILTELNLMTYDLHGSWDVLTGVNAPMFDQGWTDKTPRWSVHGCVANYVDLGVPLSKMNMGLPFYGRSFRGATGMKQFHQGADDINYHLDEGSPQYFNIVNELKGMKTYRHEKTQTQYAVFSRGGGLVSYDDSRAICDKVHYANERGMNGFLIWEISGDMLDDGTTPLIDATNDKIRHPGLDCSRLRDPSWALSETAYNLAPPEAPVDWSRYNGPSGTGGSANDFNGAAESSWESTWVPPPPAPLPAPLPAPAPTGNWAAPTPAIVQFNAPANGGSSKAAGGGRGGDCPAGKSGSHPEAGSGCKRYVSCVNGQVDGQAMPCSPGTLFDVTIGLCTWESTVQCGT